MPRDLRLSLWLPIESRLGRGSSLELPFFPNPLLFDPSREESMASSSQRRTLGSVSSCRSASGVVIAIVLTHLGVLAVVLTPVYVLLRRRRKG
jgi:hypothetical protein